jgi:hypothetical protein
LGPFDGDGVLILRSVLVGGVDSGKVLETNRVQVKKSFRLVKKTGTSLR